MVGKFAVDSSNGSIDLSNLIIEVRLIYLTISQLLESIKSLLSCTQLSLESSLGSCSASDFVSQFASIFVCSLLGILGNSLDFSVLSLKLRLQVSDLSLEIRLHLIDRRSKRVDLSLQVLDFIIVVLTRRQVC